MLRILIQDCDPLFATAFGKVYAAGG